VVDYYSHPSRSSSKNSGIVIIIIIIINQSLRENANSKFNAFGEGEAFWRQKD
jgi:hypothetical protein